MTLTAEEVKMRQAAIDSAKNDLEQINATNQNGQLEPFVLVSERGTKASGNSMEMMNLTANILMSLDPMQRMFVMSKVAGMTVGRDDE